MIQVSNLICAWLHAFSSCLLGIHPKEAGDANDSLHECVVVPGVYVLATVRPASQGYA